MANTEIDSLSLNITINGLNDRDIKNLESLSESIAKLQRNLRKLELSKLQEIKIPENVKGLTGVTYDIKPITDVIKNTDFDKMFDGVEETFTQIGNEASAVFDDINTDVEEVKVNTKDTNEELKKTPKNLNKSSKELNKIDKTLKRIKVISFIKLIRGAINSFVKGIEQGVKNLALFDSKFNETMSTLNTAKTQIYNSLALTISPLITSLVPLIETLSQGMIQIANTISKVSAYASGMTKYTKVNADYMEDYAKSLQKASNFSFDTFNTLQTQDSMFETAELDESEISQYEDLLEIVESIKNVFEEIKGAVKFVGNFVSNFLKGILGNIKKIIEDSNEFTTRVIATFEKLQLDNLFKTLIEGIFPTIINSVGVILDFITRMADALSPLVNVILNKLLPAILKLINNSLKPIFALLEKIVFPLIVELVETIVDILEPAIEVISEIIEEINIVLSPIMDIIVSIIDMIGDIIPFIKLINNILNFNTQVSLKLIAAIIGTINDLLDSMIHLNFDGFIDKLKERFGEFGRYVAKIFENLINSFIEFINIFIANDFVKTIASWFGGEGWKGIEWRADFNIPGYANGGQVGEVWRMNEHNNPEMLFNGNNNANTSVINIDQLSRAFEQAIYNTGLLNAIEEGNQVYIDGKYIAQSKNFKNEINRTNPKLAIR